MTHLSTPLSDPFEFLPCIFVLVLSLICFSFLVVPWPGFYIYNVTYASIKENWFKDVAPRSLVIRTGTTDTVLPYS